MLDKLLLLQLSFGTLLIVICVVFHVAGLVTLANILRHISARFHFRTGPLKTISFLTLAILCVIFLHTAEIWMWALIYIQLGEFVDLGRAVYFSAVTATTLGYGDITLSGQWQLLASFEAMAGLILFATSTAFLIELMRNLFTGMDAD